jgi:hypothetical protein
MRHLRPAVGVQVAAFVFSVLVAGVALSAQIKGEVSKGVIAKKKMNEPTRFYCNTKALRKDERAVYNELTSKLSHSRAETKELTDGYAFRLHNGTVSIADLATWISYERKCCPFFTFEIELERNGGPLWL